MIAFCTLRKLWLAFAALLGVATIVLSIAVFPTFAQADKPNLWVFILIPLGGIIRSAWSIAGRKGTNREPVLVAAEMLWATAGVPFELCLVLFILALRPQNDAATRMSAILLHVLKFVVYTKFAFVCIYAVSILTLAVLARLSFDRSVFRRDIDSSPSPFPTRVLLSYAFPCLVSTPPSSPTLETMEHQHCMPGCTCNAKLRPPNEEGVGVAGERTGSGSQVPIRIPNELERRAIIVVALEPAG